MTNHEFSRRSFLLGSGAVALGAGALALSGCAGSSTGASGSKPAASNGTVKRGGVASLCFTGSSDTESLDPALSIQPSSLVLMLSMYERLVQLDDKMLPKPWLATSWQTDDSRRWTFQLREGVKFHDGSPFTADDAAYSLKRLLDPAVKSSLFAQLSEVLRPEGIEAVDQHTLSITLTKPNSQLTQILGQNQAAIAKAGTKSFSTKTAIGTGPFKIVAFTPGQRWEVAKHAEYWQSGKPYLDGIKAIHVPDSATKVQAVQSGTADWCDSIDFSVAKSISSGGGGNVRLSTLKDRYIIDIAMDLTVKPFDDPRVVEAIKLAVDREQILDLAYRGFGTVTADVPCPPSDPYYPKALATPKRDIAKAKQLLAEAGHPNGIDLELYTTPASGGMVEMATVFAQTVKPAGIRVKINQQPVDSYFINTWLHKPMCVSYWGRRNTAQALNVMYQSKAPWNESRYKSSELDQLLTKSSRTADEQEQIKFIQDAVTMVSQHAGTVIPATTDLLMLSKNRLHGVKPDYTTYADFTEAYLD